MRCPNCHYKSNISRFMKPVSGFVAWLSRNQEDKVELNVSGEIVEIVFENVTKVDSDDDGFYDLEISLGGVNSIYAELSIKSIYEEMPAISEEAKIEGEVDLEIEEEGRVGFFRRLWDWLKGLFSN